VLIAATTDCFRQLPFQDAVQRIIDLEYTSVEIPIREGSQQVTPAQVAADLEAAITICHNPGRLHVVAYSLESLATGEEYFQQFEAICKMARATRVISVTVESGVLGTPFNEEVERLQQLVEIATTQGVLVSMCTKIGCLSEDPDTVTMLCNHVTGLGLTLDPSFYVHESGQGRNMDKVIKYVYHVRLRDTSESDMQVQIGQGDVDFSRLLTQLRLQGYQRALSVHIDDVSGSDQFGEMRKMRLLLESLL
jgi:sugar phosphate isomerase/epimerase